MVQAQFDEAVDPSSVNGRDGDRHGRRGRQLAADVRYDGASDQMQRLRARSRRSARPMPSPSPPGVRLRGNPMAANYSWSFTISSIGEQAGQRALFMPMIAR